MRKVIIAMLLAGAATSSALAAAQDGRFERRAARVEQQDRAERPQRAERFERAERPQQAEAPQRVEQPQQQRVEMARPERVRGVGGAGFGGQGGGEWRGGTGVQTQVIPQAVVEQRQYRGGNDGGAWRQRMGQAVVQQQLGQDGQIIRQDGRRDGTRWGDHVRSNDGQAWNGQRDGSRDRGQWQGRDGQRRDGNRDRGQWNGQQRGGQQWSGQQWAGNNDRGGQRWSNNWRSNPRYNWQDYRSRNRSLFRVGRFYDPFGYGYQRLSIGFTLYSGYYQSNYWLNDPYQYRLPPVYGPYRWVRYYDDAVLVDIYSGEVVDVIQGFFW